MTAKEMAEIMDFLKDKTYNIHIYLDNDCLLTEKFTTGYIGNDNNCSGFNRPESIEEHISNIIKNGYKETHKEIPTCTIIYPPHRIREIMCFNVTELENK